MISVEIISGEGEMNRLRGISEDDWGVELE